MSNFLGAVQILEATVKNVAYNNKSKLFLHIYIFFRTFAAQMKICRHINIALLLFRVQEKSLRN